MTHASRAQPTSSDSPSTVDERPLVIGVGTRDRGDDAVGPIVCDLVAAGDPGARTLVVEGSLFDLALRWTADDRVVIVDAMTPAGAPGTVEVIDALHHTLVPPGTVSTHAVDLATGIEIAKALGRLPAELTVIGIEAAVSDEHTGLSEEVAAAARRIAGRLLAGRPF